MKVLRIKLTQSQASYTREETVNNRMTYPLPPLSTVIGALHNACGYTTYHPMDISIQGRYGAMQSEVYVNHALLNSTQDDRGVLVWLKNSDALNAGYTAVAEALNGTGNSFEKKITICEYDHARLEEYIMLRKLEKTLQEHEKTQIKPQENAWKEEKKKLKEKLKGIEKNSAEAKEIQEKIALRDQEIKLLKETFQEEREQTCREPFSHFRTLTKGPQHQEVLYDVELVIHVAAEDKVLEDILAHQNDLVCLGRSEDFVEVVEMKAVELSSVIDKELGLPKNYAILVNVDRVKDEEYFVYTGGEAQKAMAEGTIYYVAKNYEIINGKRDFNRIPCFYSSNIFIDENSENILWDSDGDYIVDLN